MEREAKVQAESEQQSLHTTGLKTNHSNCLLVVCIFKMVWNTFYNGGWGWVDWFTLFMSNVIGNRQNY